MSGPQARAAASAAARPSPRKPWAAESWYVSTLSLFVAGDLTLSGDFAVDLEPGAELGVFVAGDLIVSDAAQIGTPDRPAAPRLYVAGTAPIRITNQINYAAQISAPNAPVQGMVTGTPPFTATWGAIVAARFET